MRGVSADAPAVVPAAHAATGTRHNARTSSTMPAQQPRVPIAIQISL
jgi:hypothetical protein